MEWIELGKLGKVSTGNTPSKKKIEYYNENYIELVKPSNFTENMIVSIESGEEYLSKEGKSKGRVAGVGDILVTCIGNIGNVGIVSKEVCFNQQINGIKVDKKKALSKYVAYAILYIKPALNHVANKAVVPIIKKSTFEKMKIPVPPIEIQKKIVEVLDESQKLLDNRKKQIELLDDLIESIFYDMFGDPVKNDKGWEVKKLGELIEVNPKKSEVSGIKDSDLEISFVPMENVLEDGKLILEETRKISEVYKGYTYFKEGDILFAKITPCMENGKGCVAKGLLNNIGFGSTEFHVLRPKDDMLTKEYVFNLTKSKKFRKEAENEMTGSAGQKRVQKKFIEDYSINIPPIQLQNQFAEKVQAIEKQKELLEESLKLMEDNYNSLMQRAFKGELF